MTVKELIQNVKNSFPGFDVNCYTIKRPGIFYNVNYSGLTVINFTIQNENDKTIAIYATI